MATLRERPTKAGKVRYQMIVEIYKKGNRFFKSKTFDTESEAKRWAKTLSYEIEKGMVAKELLKDRKFNEAVERYIHSVLPHKPKNAKNVIQHLRWWTSQIGHLPLSEIFPDSIAKCRDKLLYTPNSKGLKRSNTTVVRYLASVSTVFEYCIKEWHWMLRNPVRQIKKPSLNKGKTRFFSIEEIKKIRALCKQIDSPMLFPVFLLGLHTGMRKGEILSLRWSYIDFTKKEILLPTSKTGEPRDVPMTNEVYHLLLDLHASRSPQLNDLLFPSPNNPKTAISLRSAWERVLRLANIEGATFHTLRHTACTFLAKIGVSSILIARIAGHLNSRTTDRYTHAVKEHLHESIKKLEHSLKC